MPNRKYKLITAAAVLCFLIWILVPGYKKVPLENLGYARIRPATFIRSIFPEANATIRFYPRSGQPGDVILWQDVFDGPVLLIEAKDPGVFFCLYDFDTGFLLIKIDTKKPFAPLEPDDTLNHFLFSSSWKISIERGDGWGELIAFLKTTSGSDYRRQLLPSSFHFRSSWSPETILHSLSYYMAIE